MKYPEIKIISSEDAVSETIGYSFILAIVIIAVGILVVIAFPIQSEIQNTAFIESQIQALTMLDSRISSVALGTTPSQFTRINLNGGVMNVRNDTDNNLKVIVANETGYNITIFNQSMGLIEYKLGDERLIFENGGMFRIYPNGESVMLSPPEFYFNGETLTFPVIRIANTASTGGKGTISVIANSGEDQKIIYPNLSSSLLFNPIYGRQILIGIKSDNYKAWARYIEERTDAAPLPEHVNKVVWVSFNSKPSERPMDLVVPIKVFGLDTTNSTPLTQFSFNLTAFDPSGHMVLRAPDGDSEIFALDMKKESGPDSIEIEVKYNDKGHNETWYANKLAIIIPPDDTVNISLLNHSINGTYKSSDPSGTWMNETPPYNDTYINNDCCVPLDVIIQHYIKLISESGTFALYASTKPNEWKDVGFGNSSYALSYTIMPPNINYLHIVDHSVNITAS